ncbi:tRNA (adenosine(37)-N6)-threonylcarbamoyltransferase complex transferase subunit TsaD [bacterium]|nr:tRNA (adenosine(37)-N6)-threonylcarbamoyltransferase complex transferase subunit TsaD [bacterium]
MNLLGIDTSFDDTAAAVVADGRTILSNVVSSRLELHEHFGGIVPEVAFREHVLRIQTVVEEALARANTPLDKLDAVAVTYGPGLLGSLMVGVSFARALAVGRGLPTVLVNHLEGHLYSPFLSDGAEPRFPHCAMIVSGGHTSLYRVEAWGKYTMLGNSRDDAAGEAFDKVAKFLGLGYPGGPIVDQYAQRAKAGLPDLPRPMLHSDDYDFSFSGLKTAVIARLVKAEKDRETIPAEDVCRGVLEAVVEVLTSKAMAAALDHGLSQLTLSGGVAANATLRDALAREAEKQGIEFLAAPRTLATDNAAMIAGVGWHLLSARGPSPLDQDVMARLPLGPRESHP